MRFVSQSGQGCVLLICKRVKYIHHRGRWRKLKGTAILEYSDGQVWLAEVHWFEAHGVGRKDFKSITVHLDPYTKGILHAEAIAADTSVSALLRKWIDERLDAPVLA